MSLRKLIFIESIIESMIFQKNEIEGLYLIEPEPNVDARGYFMRIFCQKELNKIGIKFNIVQINHSLTKKKGTIRGLHFQKEPKAETKIVQCLRGAIYDVAVDLRKRSKTYRQWIAVKLSEKNKKMFLIPKGFAHGFQALTNNVLLQYSMSEFYYPEYNSGIRWDDPSFNIKWPIKNPLLSKKDKNLPSFKKYEQF